MRSAVQITTAVTDIVTATNWTQGMIYNNSDTTIYLGWTESAAGIVATPLTTANGMPLEAGQYLALSNPDASPRGKVQGIHGASGNKEVRIAFETSPR